MKKFLLIIIALVILGYLYSWRYYSLVKDLNGNRYFTDQIPRDNPAAALLTHEQYLALGWVESQTKNLSFYPNHPLQKPPGIIRIGIFGGSRSVYGGWSKNRDYTYPGLLQEEFKKQGFNQVEVINFGASNYGMTQEYMLWKFLGQKYDLDYVVFTINDNIKLRDDVFNNDMDLHSPLHARYVLDHGKLHFIPVVGDTRQKAYKIYQMGIPALRYLLYERRLPFSLKIFLPKIFHSRSNPFYYWHGQDWDKENFLIYAAMLENVARKAKHVILVVKQSDINTLSKLIKAPNIYLYTSSVDKIINNYAYFSEDGVHTGPLGNSLIADELFSLLIGKDTWEGVSLQLKPYQCSSSNSKKDGIIGDLSNYDHLDLKVQENTVGRMLYININKHLLRPFYKGLLDGSEIKSFLMLPNNNMKFISFLALPFDIKEDQKVLLSFRARGEMSSFLIGTVHVTNKIEGELELTKGAIVDKQPIWNGNIEGAIIISDKDILKQLEGIASADIVINNRKVISVNILGNSLFNQVWAFDSQEYLNPIYDDQKLNIVCLRADNSYFFKGNPFDSNEGTIDLVVTKKNGEQQRSPVFLYKLIHFQEPIPNPYTVLTQEISKSKVTK